MPVRYPDEFRQRAIELARTGDKPVAQIAADLGIATSCLRRWMKQDDIDGGRARGPRHRRAGRAGAPAS